MIFKIIFPTALPTASHCCLSYLCSLSALASSTMSLCSSQGPYRAIPAQVLLC